MNRFSIIANSKYRLLVGVLLFCISSIPVYGKVAYVGVPIKIIVSDVIARVKVLSTTNIDDPHYIASSRFYRIAQMEVIQAYKGLDQIETFEIEYDYGYETDKEYLIFAIRKENGRYYTYNSYCGRFLIENEHVSKWEYKIPSTSYEKVLAELKSFLDVPERWSVPVHGLSVLLRPTRFIYHHNRDINLFFMVKNVSKDDITIQYSNYPLKNNTYWKLNIRNVDGKLLVPQQHPNLTETSIEQYFSQHGYNSSAVIRPGEIFPYRLQRVNSAKTGYGYKERLNFMYYPINTSGLYRISASVYNLYNEHILTTEEIEIMVHE